MLRSAPGLCPSRDPSVERGRRVLSQYDQLPAPYAAPSPEGSAATVFAYTFHCTLPRACSPPQLCYEKSFPKKSGRRMRSFFFLPHQPRNNFLCVCVFFFRPIFYSWKYPTRINFAFERVRRSGPSFPQPLGKRPGRLDLVLDITRYSRKSYWRSRLHNAKRNNLLPPYKASNLCRKLSCQEPRVRVHFYAPSYMCVVLFQPTGETPVSARRYMQMKLDCFIMHCLGDKVRSPWPRVRIGLYKKEIEHPRKTRKSGFTSVCGLTCRSSVLRVI